MNHKANSDGEGDDAIPTAAPTCPGVRRRDNVLPFRRVEAAASCVGPAASSPYSADGLDAHFIPVGQAVAAVVMSLRGGLPRINCDRPDGWEMEEDHRDGL